MVTRYVIRFVFRKMSKHTKRFLKTKFHDQEYRQEYLADRKNVY